MRRPNTRFSRGGMPFAIPVPGENPEAFQERKEELSEIWRAQRSHARETVLSNPKFIVG